MRTGTLSIIIKWTETRGKQSLVPFMLACPGPLRWVVWHGLRLGTRDKRVDMKSSKNGIPQFNIMLDFHQLQLLYL